LGHPLHPIPLDAMGAAWADVHERMSCNEFADGSLSRWRETVNQGEGAVVFESFPFQSAVRVLLQMDSASTLIEEYWRAWQAAVAPAEPALVFLRTAAPTQLIDNIAAHRGTEWGHYLATAVERMPFAFNRGLFGWPAVHAFLVSYNDLIESLVRAAGFPVVVADAQPLDYALRECQILENLGR
jgi:hypothetical protein